MHVRGSSLSQPIVIEALRPFIVAFWGQKQDEAIPDDLLPYYNASGFGHSNVRCFVLDAEAQLLHSFNGFPGNSGNPLRYSDAEYAAYFAGEIQRGLRGIQTQNRQQSLRLPSAQNGVRLFVRLPESFGSYNYPVVETVENKDEWATLEFPITPRTIPAGKFLRWLRYCYPPGVNEQLDPFGLAKGDLQLRPAGKDKAVLSGDLKLALAEGDYELFEGRFEAVVTYGARTEINGVISGTYWRKEPRRDQWVPWRLTTVVESTFNPVRKP